MRGSSDGSTVITGAVAMTPEPGLVTGYDRLGQAARSKARLYRMPQNLAPVRQIDTPQKQGSSVLVERFVPATAPSLPFEVFDADGSLRPARWPNVGWAEVVRPTSDGWWGVTSDASRLEAWRGEPDLWAAGYWKWDYAFERHRVREIGEQTLMFTTPLSMGLKDRARYRVYHALAELDAPGEWYRDHARNVLIAWPRQRSNSLELSIAESAIVSDGASHVRIQDVTIEKFHGDGVRVHGGQDFVVERTTIRWAGMRGISFVDAYESGITTSDIADTGEGGVLLSGGDRQTLSPARLFARSCRIERFARIAHTFRPAIDMTGVGQIAAGNFIADAPNFGIQFQGNDHLIEGNEITNVVNDTTDAGALYSGHDWTARGTIIRHNFIHDVKGSSPGFETKGVYLDDFASGVTIEGNLFLRVEQPVFIGGGRDNLVEGNIFIAATPAVHIDARGLEWASKSVTDPASELRKRLLAAPTTSDAWRKRYPRLPAILSDEPGEAKHNVSRNNSISGGEVYRLAVMAKAKWQTLGPDFGVEMTLSPVTTTSVQAAQSAKTAVEVGTLLASGIATAGGASLQTKIPFATMDRIAAAGRKPQRQSRAR